MVPPFTNGSSRDVCVRKCEHGILSRLLREGEHKPLAEPGFATLEEPANTKRERRLVSPFTAVCNGNDAGSGCLVLGAFRC